MIDIWGAGSDYLHDAWVSEALPPERLPAVVRSVSEGWFLAPDAPLWWFLPAIWPARARAWVPDRSVPVIRMVCGDGTPARTTSVIPWSAWDHAEMEEMVAADLEHVGLPPRPAGRLWLLRPPPGWADVDEVLGAVGARADADGVPWGCCPELVAHTRSLLDRWFAAES